jgi:hypothetical protein
MGDQGNLGILENDKKIIKPRNLETPEIRKSTKIIKVMILSSPPMRL